VWYDTAVISPDETKRKNTKIRKIVRTVREELGELASPVFIVLSTAATRNGQQATGRKSASVQPHRLAGLFLPVPP